MNEKFISVDDITLIPQYGKLQSRKDAQMKGFIYSAPMDTVTGYNLAKAMLAEGEYPVVCRYLEDEWKLTMSEEYSNPNCFFAIGVGANLDLFFRWLDDIDAKTPLDMDKISIAVAIDIAHGDSVMAEQTIKALATCPWITQIMSGSICTPQAALRAVEWGCTHLRVGVGSGAACTTRLMTGCGVPQASAVHAIYTELDHQNVIESVELIADGGIRYPGDAVKYLALGADAVMMGKAFCATQESAGWIYDTGIEMRGRMPIITGEPRRYKHYRGQASSEFQTKQFGQQASCPEGASNPNLLAVDGTAKDVINYYRGGVASALSYLGLEDIEQLCPENVDIAQQTSASYIEGTPHGC